MSTTHLGIYFVYPFCLSQWPPASDLLLVRLCPEVQPPRPGRRSLSLWSFSVPGLYLPGVDLITACDIRYCAQDAFFQVKVSRLSELLLPRVLCEAG